MTIPQSRRIYGDVQIQNSKIINSKLGLKFKDKRSEVFASLSLCDYFNVFLPSLIIRWEVFVTFLPVRS